MTLGSSCWNRSSTVFTPNSAGAEHHTAPIAAVASIAMTACGTFGRYDTTRSPGTTPNPRRPVARALTCSLSSVHDIRPSGESSDWK